MKHILITGATGKIGHEIIRSLFNSESSDKVIAGCRNVDKAKALFKEYDQLKYVHFDFEKPDTFDRALEHVDMIFLLRPPHISDIDKYIQPFIHRLNEKQINKIVFLSVQGAEKSKVIPHNKIERLINEYGMDYIFLRPSYFMQNLSTALLSDIKTKREIILPAGKAKFNWIDIENIGEAGSVLLNKFDDYKNQALELTGSENEDFYTVTHLINSQIDNPIRYRSVNPLRFYWLKKKEAMIPGMIMVMIMLHFLPRFQKQPKISNTYEKLTGKLPIKLIEYIKREKNSLK